MKLVIANWKMNPKSVGEAKKLFITIRAGLAKGRNQKAVIAPPFPYIAELRKLSMGKRTLLAAQDVHPLASGPHTGGVSAAMLKSLDVAYIIVGHSERRAAGDTDESVREKIKAVLRERMIPVLCVGELSRDAQGTHYAFVERQLAVALEGISRAELAKIVIAYEPVWAISKGDGKGETATPEHAHEMKLFIQKVLADLYGRKYAMAVKILYGGSVNPDNAREMLKLGEADGFLVGGASLDAKSFLSITDAASRS